MDLIGREIYLGEGSFGEHLVYWMSLARIPKTILNKIRQRAINFLWTRNKIKEGVHLVNLETLSSTKSLGGWGLQNIASFAKDLAKKIPWRGLFTNNIWNEILNAIYI